MTGVFAQFEKAWQIPVFGSTTSDVALGDVDGDGDLDAGLMQGQQNGVLLLNNGNGFFSPSPTGSILPKGASGRFGLLNDDEFPDLFVAVHLGPCQVWFNDGSGNFVDSGQSIGGTDSRTTMELADIDEDGDLDAILPANSPSSNNQIWLNDGNGVFSDSGQSLGMDFTIAVKFLDVNDDTHGDIIFGNNGTNRVWLNDSLGNGNFTLSPTSLGGGTTHDLAVGDVNGDSAPDVVVINGSTFGDANEVWLNNGSGTFTDSGQLLGTEFSLSGILSDVDGDGDSDLVEGTITNSPNRLWLNDGSGNFTDSGESFGTGRVNAIAAGMLGCDGFQDFFFAISNGPSKVWTGSKTGTLVDSGQQFGSSEASCAAAGDMDGDGDLDVVLGSLGGVIRILLNDGSGRFYDADIALVNGEGNNNGAIAVADFNGDGHVDIVAANNYRGAGGDEMDRIWLNDGAGGFTLDPDFLDDENGSAIAVADLNGDTYIDIIIGNGNTDFGQPGANSIWLNDGLGNFTESNVIGLGNTKSVVVADLAGDNSPDIFVGNTGGEPNRIFIGDGSGGFTDSGQAIGSSRTNVAVAYDFDGVNGIDVFCGNFNEDSKLWINNGTGTLSDSGQSFGSSSTKSAGAVDADGDGILDLFIGNGVNIPETDHVRMSDGSGNFSFLQALESHPTSAVLVGDFSGDGIDDVFTSSEDGTHTLWNRALVCPDVEAYAADHGLTGNNTLAEADPDGDGLPNYVELAYNLDPAASDAEPISDFSTATGGLPRVLVVGSGSTRNFRAEFIRRRNTSCFYYNLTISPCLVGFAPPGVVSVSSEIINADYERVSYLYSTPIGTERMFGRFELSYEP